MKKNIKTRITVIAASLLIGVSSCNYLEVVPIEQPDLDDMMVDSRSTLEYLYSCYGYMQNVANITPLKYSGIEGGTDEFVVPQTLNEMSSAVQYNNITPVNAFSLKNHYPWRVLYEAIGYCNQFLSSIKENAPEEVTAHSSSINSAIIIPFSTGVSTGAFTMYFSPVLSTVQICSFFVCSNVAFSGDKDAITIVISLP